MNRRWVRVSCRVILDCLKEITGTSGQLCLLGHYSIQRVDSFTLFAVGLQHPIIVITGLADERQYLWQGQLLGCTLYPFLRVPDIVASIPRQSMEIPTSRGSVRVFSWITGNRTAYCLSSRSVGGGHALFL